MICWRRGNVSILNFSRKDAKSRSFPVLIPNGVFQKVMVQIILFQNVPISISISILVSISYSYLCPLSDEKRYN